MMERSRSILAGAVAAIGLVAFSISGCGTSTTAPGLVPVDCDENPTADECQNPDPGQRLEAPTSQSRL